VDESGVPHRLAVSHCDPEKEELAREYQGIPIGASTSHPVL
jgi:hypothetical protein